MEMLCAFPLSMFPCPSPCRPLLRVPGLTWGDQHTDLLPSDTPHRSWISRPIKSLPFAIWNYVLQAQHIPVLQPWELLLGERSMRRG